MRPRKRSPRILLASSEVHPFSKTGGLADMVGALARSLASAGADVGVVTPLYRGIQSKVPGIEPFDWVIDVPLGGRRVQGGVACLSPQKGLTYYFIDHNLYFNRPGIYHESNVAYPDNAERFIFFAKSVVHLARYLPWRPEVLHVHDWQAALVPALVTEARLHEGWVDAPRTCLTIHNLAYQGRFAGSDFGFTNLPLSYFTPATLEFFGDLNLLKGGIALADLVTTVSPSYAEEILTPEHGCGLDPVIATRRADLVGVLNGVDYGEWKTTANPALPASYSWRRLEGKKKVKAELQREMGLPVRAGVPLFGNISRLVDQKGSDLLLRALEQLIDEDFQFVLLGSGDPVLEREFKSLAVRFPTKVAIKVGYDQELSHRIEAGIDYFVMPSRFEPCGLNQLYSLRYGAIPIVRNTGGLSDSVIDPRADAAKANGIKFDAFETAALCKALHKALVLFRDKPAFLHLQRNGMKSDFSWERTALDYLAIYQRVLGGTTPA